MKQYTARVPVTVSVADLDQLRAQTGHRSIGRTVDAIITWLQAHPEQIAAIREHAFSKKS